MTTDAETLKSIILQREKVGEFNNLERSSDAISDNASIGVDSLEQYPMLANRIISDSKVEKSKNRESQIVSVKQSINDYEAFIKSLSDSKGRTPAMLKESFRKAHTRCAEGPEATVDLPYFYDPANPIGKAERKFSVHIHPSDILDADSSWIGNDAYQVGSIVQQTYKDGERTTVQLNSVKQQSQKIDDNFSMPRPVGGAFSAYTSGAQYYPGVKYTESDSSTMPVAPEITPDILSIKEQVGWSPKFAPLAVGSSKYTKIVVGSKFGPRGNPFGGGGKGFHSGIDMWVTALGPITAIDDGIVSYVKSPKADIAERYVDKKGKPLGHTKKGGATVIILHKTNDPNIKMRAGYCHMIKITVKKGQEVKAGDIIGYVGGGVYGYTNPNNYYDPPAKRFYCSWPGGGGSTGPHLHFSLSKVVNGKKTKVDPLMFEYPQKTIIPDEEFEKTITENRKYVNAKKKELVDLHEKVAGQKLKPK